MMMKTALLALMGLAAMTEASRIPSRHQLLSRQNRNGGNRNGGNAGNNAGNAGNAGNNAGGNNNAASETCLNANAVQTGSASTGQDGADVQAGQVNSATDEANFINFCSGETLTNGLQNTDGSCNGVVMGKIPAKASMVSAVIINPPLGETIQANTDFNVTVQIDNMQLGAFTNAQETYYSAPQDLNGQGQIIGHCHITVQDIGNSLNPQTPPDATQFAFFKGINDAGNGNGQLTTEVTGGLPDGNYRICTMNSAANHQPVLMPVAQRGSQDDCVRVVVGNANGGNNGGNNNNNNNNANAGGNNNAANGNAGNNAGANAGANAGNNAGANAGNNAGNAGNNADADAGANAGNNAGANAGNNAGANAGNNAGANAGNNAGANAGNNAGANAGNANAGANAGGNAGGRGQGRGGQAQGNTGSASTTGANGNNGSKATSAAETATATNSEEAAATTSAAASNGATGGNNNAAAGGAIGGIAAPAVEDSGDANRPFLVNGDSFVNKGAAVQRACAIQNNKCADAVNSGQVTGQTVGDCNTQEQACNAAGGA